MKDSSREPPTGYFDTAYRDYASQNPPAKLDHYLQVVAENSRSPVPSLLDVGCGRGLFLERAAARFPDWSLSGVDPDSEGVDATSGLVADADVSIGSAEDLPFGADIFDVVTAWDVLEHVAHVRRALFEIKRCLRPGGLLVVVVPVYDGITGPLVRLLDSDPTHVHKESRDFWVDLLSAGFDDVEWHGIYRYLLPGSRYVHIPTRRLRRATNAILTWGFQRSRG